MRGPVWVKASDADSKEAFWPGEIVSVEGEVAEVKLLANGGGVCRLPCSEARPRFVREDSCTASDNTALVHMNDASILDNLRARHKADAIYTYTASVLLAVNPYKTIDGLYGDTKCALYRGKHIGALPPHPYAISDTAYRMLVRDKVNQALLISGESGAGKTETAKIVMQYLAFASGATSTLASKIQSRVLQAQPILESFGNAVTLRNSNSSRFGKYNRVYFDEEGTLVDAGITTYLLESSRVVVHGDRERTYHVFYEMLEGLSDAKMKQFHLERGRSYRLTHGAAAAETACKNRDQTNFERLCAALETVGVDQASIDGCLQVLAGLVHLADVPKDEAEVEMAARASQDDDESDTRTVEVNEDSVQYAAELLGMDPDELSGTLKRKRIAIPGRDSFHEAPRSPMQFRQALHSLIKSLYNRLFEQTVHRINDSFSELRPDGENAEHTWKNIGILDIYGFERLQRNSFEQLCINLANERLQQYFVENVLNAEQQLYSREGLPWTGLPLPNSDPVVTCISHVFKTLDDFSSRLAKGFGEAQQVSDDRFCERVIKDSAADPQRKDVLKAPKVSAKNARLSQGSRANELFIITHYAGAVDYNTKGWLDKNNDRLLVECESLIAESSLPFVKAMSEEDQKQPFKSISSKYCKDLEALLQTLGEANLHYIRCFKPNALQKPDIFNGPLVLDQIVQCGTIELVKIMHDGFPNRCSFEELYNRFKALLPENFQRYGMRTFIEALMLAYEVPRAEWALGMSRLFLKAGQLQALEDMRVGGAAPKAEVLQGIVSQIVRKRWARACVAIRLCIWLPKFLRQIQVQRAATTLTATALVAGRLAPRLEAARQRVAERRLAARRRLAGTFRTVHCIGNAWRQIRERRRERAIKALYLGSFILSRAKPWISRAREYIRDAEVRRQREEEERRQELEKKMKEEEERLRAEAEKRRQDEEERFQLEAQRRREEEEARLAAEAEQRQREEAERLAAEAEQLRLEKERAALVEQERLKHEQEAEEERQAKQRQIEEERLKLEGERESMEAEKRRMAEELENHKRKMEESMEMEKQRVAAELEAERQRAAEERLAAERMYKESFDQQRQEMQEMQETVRRLSIVQQGASSANGHSGHGEDAETDGGSSVSVVQEAAKTTARNEVARLMEEHFEKYKEVQEKVQVLQERNSILEQEQDDQKSEVSGLDLSPPPNATPLRSAPGDVSPLSNISGMRASPSPGSAHRNLALSASRSSRRYSLVEPSARMSSNGTIKAQRRSIAHEAMLCMDPPQEDSSARPSAAPLSKPIDDANPGSAQRKWWAEQRSFLMDDLYPHGGGVLSTPTPSRSTRGQRRNSQAEGALPSPATLPEGGAATGARKLGPEFERADREEKAAGAPVGGTDGSDVTKQASQAVGSHGSKLKQPQVRVPKKTGQYRWSTAGKPNN